jgi:hypothetical protein
MSLLGSITRGRVVRPWRTVFYGVQGIGKSTFAAYSHNPIFIQAEEGSDQLDVSRFPRARSYADVLAQIDALMHDEHNFQTCVIDTLDELEKYVNAEATRLNNNYPIEMVEFYNGWKMVTPLWQAFLNKLDALREHRNMAILLLGHAQTQKVRPPDGDEYTEYSMSLHRDSQTDVNKLIQAWADDVLFAFIPVTLRKSGASAKGKGGRNVVVESNKRVVRTTKTLAHYAKTRCPSLPAEFPLVRDDPFAMYASHAYAGTGWATVTREVAPVSVEAEAVNTDTGEVTGEPDQGELDALEEVEK